MSRYPLYTEQEIKSIEKMQDTLDARATRIAQVLGHNLECCTVLHSRITQGWCKLSIWMFAVGDHGAKATISFPAHYLSMQDEDIQKAEEKRLNKGSKRFNKKQKKGNTK